MLRAIRDWPARRRLNRAIVADIDTVRMFDLKTGQPGRAVQIPGATVLNGIAATADGTVYVSNTREPERIFKIC
mgnify:CR=1 FL=1